MDVQQLVAAVWTVVIQQAGDDGVLLRPLEHGGGVRLVQTRAPALLCRRQAIGLTGAAYAAALAGHDLHQVVKALSGLHVGDQLLGVGQAVDDGQVQLLALHGEVHLTDGPVAAQVRDPDGLEGVVALIRQTVAHHASATPPVTP